VPRSTGIKMMLDLLHRSRLQFPSMAMGFLRRLLDEATRHCRERQVGGRSLLGYDQVQARLARIQSAFTICSAMCVNTTERAGLEQDLAPAGLEASAIKAYITDLMQEAAQSLLQLVGAKGYRIDHIAGRALVDSRPFQIFEGSNDILYAQIGESLLKRLQVARESHLGRFLGDFELTGNAAARVKKLLDFSVAPDLAQRKLVELGQVVSRLVALELVLQLGERGFSRQLIDASCATLEQELAGLLAHYRVANLSELVELDGAHPSWRDFCGADSA
jgi:Acyl-CoA dehydrogenase, C-terminal domain